MVRFVICDNECIIKKRGGVFICNYAKKVVPLQCIYEGCQKSESEKDCWTTKTVE